MSTKSISRALSSAEKFEEEEKFEEAYECYKNAYEIDKTNPEILEKLGMTAQLLHKNEEAVNYWNEMLYINPENPLPYNQLIDLYFHTNKYEYYMTRAKLKTLENRLPQAASDYKKAMNNTTDEKETQFARYLLAQTYEIIDKPMQAIDEYLRILDYDHNENAYEALAKIYYNHDKASAVDILNRALDKFPDNLMFKELLAKIYMELGEYEKSYNIATTDLSKAKALLMQEKNADAYELLQKASSEEKKTPKYISLMAEYCYNTNDFDNAFKYISELEKADNNNPLPFQMKALVYEKQNKDYEAHYNWGVYYIKKNNYDLALNEYLNAYNCDNKNVTIIKDLISLYETLDDKVASIEFTERLVNIEKGNTSALKKLYNFYFESGYDDRAIDYLNALYDINPRDPEILLSMGKYHESKNKIQSALSYYEDYLKYAPASDEQQRIERKVAQLNSSEVPDEEEGFLDKIINFFSKK